MDESNKPTNLVKPINKPSILGGAGNIEDNASVLARALFRGDLTEQEIKELHPQSLHFAIKVLGFESAVDVLPFVSNPQYRALLDLEFWTRDSFREDRFWTWLAAIDDDADLLPIQKLLKCIDPTVLNLLFRRYVEVVYHEEPTDRPPNANAYTPDGGLSWITLKAHDADKHRLLGRILAFLFQTNREAFYQYLAYSQGGTSMEFEEEAFKDKSQRLTEYSIPSIDEASELHKPIKEQEALKIVLPIIDSVELGHANSAEANAIEMDKLKVQHIVPLYASSVKYQPLFSSLERLPDEELYRIQLEFGKLCNAALSFFKGDYGEESSLKLTSEQVFGATNIGLEVLARLDNRVFLDDVFAKIPITFLYRLGLSKLFELRALSYKVPEDIKAILSHMNLPLQILLDYVAKPLPVIPEFLREDGTFDIANDLVNDINGNINNDELKTSEQVIYSLDQLNFTKNIIEKQILEKFLEIRSYEKMHLKHSLVKEGISKDVQ